MPYIPPQDRSSARRLPLTAGELNYAITALLLGYCETHAISYTLLNECVGALESAKLEFYRRKVVPYEELKRQQNGDVYASS